MIAEHEQPIVRPLEEVFNKLTVENLSACGITGVIPIEMSIVDLMLIAESRGYEAKEGVGSNGSRIGMYWVDPKKEGEEIIEFYTKPVAGGEMVYILDDKLESSQKLFLGR